MMSHHPETVANIYDISRPEAEEVIMLGETSFDAMAAASSEPFDADRPVECDYEGWDR